jgi:hypothetical protein
MSSHGRKLTQKEFEYSITKLFEGHEEINSDLIERKELELTIDYRLGINFPKERRDKLWLVHKKIENKRKYILANSLITNLLTHIIGDYKVSKLIRYMLKEYSQVLSTDEMNDFFDQTK